jgi:hypothetical protein
MNDKVEKFVKRIIRSPIWDAMENYLQEQRHIKKNFTQDSPFPEREIKSETLW